LIKSNRDLVALSVSDCYNIYMSLGQKILVISVFFFFGLALFAQNENRGVSGTSAMPLELLRPRYGEDPRFPKDYVIGELGRGDATEQTYQFARKIVASLVAGDGRVDEIVFPEQKRLAALDRLSGLGVRSWRVGGGRSEGDGGYSFLVRFLGRERSVTGELYLQWQTPIVIDEVEAEPVQTALGSEETAAETAAEAENNEPGRTEPESIAAELTVAETENAAAENAAPGDLAAEAGDAPAETEAGEAAADAGAEIDPGVETVIKEEPKLEDKPHWRVDDLLLEPPRGLSDGRYGPGGADMTPYERFF